MKLVIKCQMGKLGDQHPAIESTSGRRRNNDIDCELRVLRRRSHTIVNGKS